MFCARRFRAAGEEQDGSYCEVRDPDAEAHVANRGERLAAVGRRETRLVAGASVATVFDRALLTEDQEPSDRTHDQARNTDAAGDVRRVLAAAAGGLADPSTPRPDGWANIYSAERHMAAAGTVAMSSFGWESTSGTDYYGSLAFVLALAP